tara:strand:+ start:1805 stop:2647 length:843 start_codon:yes stop_codon:yes gene_type:complete
VGEQLIFDLDKQEADWLHSTRNNEYVQKAKIYVKDSSKAPEGANVQRGPRGGLYYESGAPPGTEAFIERQSLRDRMIEHQQQLLELGTYHPEDAMLLDIEFLAKHGGPNQQPDLKEYYSKLLETGSLVTVEMLEGESLEYVKEIADNMKKTGNAVEMKQCYMNAMNMCINDPENRILYVEGYYLFRDFPMRFGHAWCGIIDKATDRIIYFDPTQQLNGRNPVEEGVAYFGKEYTKEKMYDYMFSAEHYGGMLRAEIIEELTGEDDLQAQLKMRQYPGVGD